MHFSFLKNALFVFPIISVCLVYFHIRFLFAKVAIIGCRTMRKPHLYVIGVHNSVELVLFAGQKFMAEV